MYFVILYFNYIFQCNLYLKYNLGQTENKSHLPQASCYEWMHHMLRYLQPQVVLFSIYGLKN